MESTDHDVLTLRLLRQEKFRAALDRAKNVHKTRPTPESEALLLRCYAARAKELRAAGEALQKQPSVQPVDGEKAAERGRLPTNRGAAVPYAVRPFAASACAPGAGRICPVLCG